MFVSKIYEKLSTLDHLKNKSVHTKFVRKYDVCKKSLHVWRKILNSYYIFAAKARVIFTKSFTDI